MGRRVFVSSNRSNYVQATVSEAARGANVSVTMANGLSFSIPLNQVFLSEGGNSRPGQGKRPFNGGRPQGQNRGPRRDNRGGAEGRGGSDNRGGANQRNRGPRNHGPAAPAAPQA